MASGKFNEKRGFWYVMAWVAFSCVATVVYIIHPTTGNRGSCLASGFLSGLIGGGLAFWIGIRLRQPRFICAFVVALFPIIYWSRFLYVWSHE
jgi:hypothetical protein